MNKNKNRLVPLFLSLATIVGILIGFFFARHNSGSRLSIINEGTSKIENMLELIDDSYVDEVNMDSLVEDALPQILSELDPHSMYIPAGDAQEAEDDLRGSFSGIGVSFTMQKDTVNVMSVIKGGPSEAAGILPGDRILMADTTSLVKMEQTKVMKHLKGPKNSKVKLTIHRSGRPKPLVINVTRDDIVTHTINVSYMITSDIGYIRASSFGEQTFNEFVAALTDLKSKGMKKLIVDLRGNRGGYMHIAIQMANQFLKRDQLIVYTQGRMSPRQDFTSNGRGIFQDLPLTVLIDEGSASASEIFAGAIQDNDRGYIIGRRSFGKGLVQQPINFKDGSVVRLTIARYYTPSGRCIQKPYEKGHGEEYENDLIERYERGEFFHQDSIKQKGPKFYTRNKRVVYGGGGITPDIFVPEDTTGVTLYYKEAIYNGHTRQFSFEYTDQYRERLKQFKDGETLEKFLRQQNLLEKFAAHANDNGLQRRNLQLYESQRLFERTIIGNIIYNVMNEQEFQRFLNEDDPTIRAALKEMKEEAH